MDHKIDISSVFSQSINIEKLKKGLRLLDHNIFSKEPQAIYSENINDIGLYTVYKHKNKYIFELKNKQEAIFDQEGKKDFKKVAEFIFEENNKGTILNMNHRQVDSQFVGINGKLFYDKAYKIINLLNEEMGNSIKQISFQAGQNYVIRWGKNKLDFKMNLEDSQKYNDYLKNPQNYMDNIIIQKEDGTFNENYIFKKDVFEKNKQLFRKYDKNKKGNGVKSYIINLEDTEAVKDGWIRLNLTQALK